MIGRFLALVVIGVLLALSFALTLPTGGEVTDAAAFEDTMELGQSDADLREAEQRGLAVPRVQAYYAGYEYVVGYNGIESFVAEHARTGHDRQFGQPIELFVTDFSQADVSLTEEGYLQTSRTVGYVSAADVSVVVDSRARLPGSDVAIPFGDREAAEGFAGEYGGTVVPWSAIHDRVDPRAPLTRERFEPVVTERTAWADDAVADTRSLAERETSIVVGRDAPSVQAAVDEAPPNTTVEVPAGTYEVDHLAVEKSVTIEGQGAATLLRGDGNGSVVTLAAPRAGLLNVSVDGVGTVGSRGTEPDDGDGDVGWSERIELAYGRGDAGVEVVDANRSLVADVEIQTPSSGLIVSHSEGATIRNVSVDITRGEREGFMGVVAMYEPIVVEESSVTGGRDGVYTHRADEIVVRDNEFAGGRFGVHEMYTSGALVADNAIRNESIGVVIMTHPTGNLLVDNAVRRSNVGISTAGSASYFADNVLVDNQRGIDVLGYQSLLTHNTIVGNGAGLRTSTGPPTNLVTANDVVDNERFVRAQEGALRVWTVRGAGNYWGPMPATDADADGHYDRPFRPSGSLDGQLHESAGAWTLARSPAVELVRGVQDSVPGLRASGVVDSAPRVEPARPERLAAVRAGNATAEGSP